MVEDMLRAKFMKSRKWGLLIAGALILCFVVLREIGVIDVNWYKSMLSASQKVSLSEQYSGHQKHFSYDLTIQYKSQTLKRHSHAYDNQPPIEIKAVIEEPVYSGSYVWPLVKNFTMTYRCTFDTTNSQGGRKVAGKIEGEIKATVHGLCSQRKAKELAFGEAKNQIVTYLQTQLDS